MLMTDQQPAELTEPGIGAFDDPAAFVSPQFAAIFVAPVLVVACGTERSNRCPASSAVRAAGRSRRRGRRSPFSASAADGLWARGTRTS